MSVQELREGEESPRRKNKMAVAVFGAIFFLGYSYACLFALNAVLFKFGNRLPFPVILKELCTSLNYFDYTTHPQYRKAWKGFVMEPGKPWKYSFRGDTFETFAVPEDAPEFSLPVDEWGFINDKPIGQADYLMIGDSFVRSSGCLFEETLPSKLEKISGKKVYAAGQAGYGWANYLDIFRWLVRTGPDSSRFKGGHAFIVFYAGNDFSDMMTYLRRRKEEGQKNWAHYFKLRTITELGRFAYGGLRSTVRRLFGKPLGTSYFDNVETEFRPYANKKAAKGGQVITQDMTKGFYPHRLNLKPYKDVDFAFNVYIRKHKNPDWITYPEIKDEARRIFDEFKGLQDETGIRLHFVLVPNNVLALEPYVTVNRPAKYLFDEVFHPSARSFDQLMEFAEAELKARGLDAINLKKGLIEAVKSEKIWWPGDTHFTPQGNEFVAKSIAQHVYASALQPGEKALAAVSKK